MQSYKVSVGIASKAVLLGGIISSGVFALNNGDGVGVKPPMGWSTFNQWGGAWSPEILKEVADSLVKTGLKDCGYEYVNADGHNNGEEWWPGGTGFVAWASPVSQYVHGKGLKFGVYMTLVQDPTPAGHQLVTSHLQQAQVDYLKHDQFTNQDMSYYQKARDAAKAAGRPIFYSVHSGNKFCPDSLCHMYRTGSDIEANWTSVMANYDRGYSSLTNVKPYWWADPDMMQVYSVDLDASPVRVVLTDAENRSHFSMWCMMAAPLIMGYNITRKEEVNWKYVDNFTMFTYANHQKSLAVHGNTEMIAVDQDPLGKAGRRIKGASALEVWVKDLSDGTKAVAFFNRTSSSAAMTISKTDLAWTSAQVYVRNLWTHQAENPFATSFSVNVASHATEVYKMSQNPISTPIAQLQKMERLHDHLVKGGHPGVLPRSVMLSVVSGNHPSIGLFDLRGRSVAHTPATAGSGMFIARSYRGQESAAKVLWQKGSLSH